MNSPPLQLRFEPAPPKWNLRTGAATLAAAAFRAQLGLPAGPVVLSGHQAGLWHGGILAKHLASLAFAQRAGASAAWIVVDQDEADPPGIRVPVRSAQGQLAEWRWQWGESAGRIASGLPPVRVNAPALRAGESPATESLRIAVERVRSSMERHAGSRNFAVQVTGAASDLLAPEAPGPAAVYQSALASTQFFQKVVDGLIEAGKEGIRWYNEAIASVPGSGMRMLDESSLELPLWDLRGGRRKRVTIGDASRLDRSTIAPRGMLMTAVLRLAACDLFVHGTGGGAYDHATEAWLGRWQGDLGRLAAELAPPAPMAVASADVFLPLGHANLPREEEIQHAVWLAHRAQHDPGVLGDPHGAVEKTRLIRAIGDRKARGEQPREEFAELHALLSEVRLRHASRIEELRERARELASRRRESALAFDRTWSFALFERSEIAGLWRSIRERFAGES